ncbi:hypothetical protein [Litorihabitans aurantiacus]|uniref:Secreted protein n=1 Tax=Litorihabitans aurantiacus TaxID=1930061 RepID=A0AA37UGJ4_9MICO|nr:hypothetical protein [Litorihabitans aurantiacus]GMA30198.1 hypothetical protein GCM10025875_01900 [Litorihabitans aurantiacus]
MTSTPTAPRRSGPVVPPPPGRTRGAPAGPQGGGKGAPPQGQGSKSGVRSGWRARMSRTPGRLRLAIVLAVVASLLVSLAGVLVGSLTQATSARVVDRVDAILQLQTARADLVTASGTASNAYLVGGLEPTEQREAYDAALAAGTAGVAALAGGDADTDGSLDDVAAALTTYAGLVEQARANNRQGFPVGAAYLDTSAALLEQDVLPPLDAAIVANAEATASDLNSASAISGLLWIVIVGVLVLVGIQIWLARRTRRTLNPALVVGTGLALVAWLACALAVGSSNDTLTETRQGPYAATLAMSQALSHAGEARTAESFGLIQRGSGAAAEETFDAAIMQAEDQLDRRAVIGTEATDDLAAWVEGHDEIRALDDAGDWDGAVALATSDASGDPTDRYLTFVETASAAVEQSSATARSEFRSASTGVGIASWVLVAAGLASAVLAWRGINKRLEEYR